MRLVTAIHEYINKIIKNNENFQLDQTTLGLPTKDYFLHPSNAIYLTAYKNYLISVATLLGASAKTACIQAEKIIQFEIQLANVKYPNNMDDINSSHFDIPYLLPSRKLNFKTQLQFILIQKYI
jgi:predicted metalloendopeptidase